MKEWHGVKVLEGTIKEIEEYFGEQVSSHTMLLVSVSEPAIYYHSRLNALLIVTDWDV